MNEADTRTAILKMAAPSRKAVARPRVRRIKQNKKARVSGKANLAKHGLKGASHASRNPS
jgi:hypothetical protein